MSRDKIVGRKLDDFAEPEFKLQLPALWQDFLGDGEQEGTLRLTGPDGGLLDVPYTAKGNVLPVRHLLVLRGATSTSPVEGSVPPEPASIPSWVQDFALFLLGEDGRIADWYAGAARIYGFDAREAVGQPVSFLYPFKDALAIEPREELTRAATAGHFGYECWNLRKDGSRFWANVITMALRDSRGDLQGYARVVRDFSERHERDEKVRRNRARTHRLPTESTIAGIVSGEFDRVPEANDAFLSLVGYSREDLQTGRLSWPDLTPQEYSILDDLAHEEGLRFGACTPYEKELICKNGKRVPVLVATAVLKLSPFVGSRSCRICVNATRWRTSATTRRISSRTSKRLSATAPR